MSIAKPGASTGTSSVATFGAPMSTLARTMTPFSHTGVTTLSPDAVSTTTGDLSQGTIPCSTAKLTRQRTPLPHIWPSEPSALNIVILTSAWADSPARISPSEPIPVCLSLIAAATAGQSSSLPRAST